MYYHYDRFAVNTARMRVHGSIHWVSQAGGVKILQRYPSGGPRPLWEMPKWGNTRRIPLHQAYMRFRRGDLESWRLFNADIGQATHYPEPETLNQQAKP